MKKMGTALFLISSILSWGYGQSISLNALKIVSLSQTPTSSEIEVGFTAFRVNLPVDSIQVSFFLINENTDSISLGSSFFKLIDLEKDDLASPALLSGGKCFECFYQNSIAPLNPGSYTLIANVDQYGTGDEYSFRIADNPFPPTYDSINFSHQIIIPDSLLSSRIMTENIGDFDGDGIDDLAVLYSTKLDIYIEGFCSKITYEPSISDSYFYDIQSGFFDEDSYSDILLGLWDSNNNYLTLELLKGQELSKPLEGTPISLAPTASPFGRMVTFSNVGDINNDGMDELGVIGANIEMINLGNDTVNILGIESLPFSINNLDFKFHRVEDIDGDGINDFTISNLLQNKLFIFKGQLNADFFMIDILLDRKVNSYSNFYFFNNVISGNFTNDDINDLIIIPRQFGDEHYGMFLIEGGESLKLVDSLQIPNYPFGVHGYPFKTEQNSYVFSVGDTNGNGFDEVLFTPLHQNVRDTERNSFLVDSRSFTDDSYQGTVLNSPLERKGYGLRDPRFSLFSYKSAYGDFDGDGSKEIVFRPFFGEFTSLYVYNLNSNEGSFCEEAVPLEFIPALSINRIGNHREITVYPNPSAKNILINSERGEIKNWKITDLTGKVLKKEAFKTKPYIINIEELKEGVYFLIIGDSIMKFVKK